MATSAEIILTLAENVASSSVEGLVDKLLNLGMTQVPYKDVGFSSNLPSFDAAYHFLALVDENYNALTEVLAKDGFVLQAGFQISVRRALFFSKVDKVFCQLNAQLENYYDAGLPMNIVGSEIVNYSGQDTAAYSSKTKAAGVEVVTVRVGNRLFWR